MDFKKILSQDKVDIAQKLLDEYNVLNTSEDLMINNFEEVDFYEVVICVNVLKT